MKAMILAAGRGSRMAPLTNTTPKPLLEIFGRPIIFHTLAALAQAKVTDVVINLHYLGEQIRQRVGDGSNFGMNVHYSTEEKVLESGGGILKALPMLGPDPFIVVSGDLFTDYLFTKLPQQPQGLAHLVLVDNPPFHAAGDFCLAENKLSLNGDKKLNFAGIGVYRPELFANVTQRVFKLGGLLQQAIARGDIFGEYYPGRWHNIGTPEQLLKLT